MKKQLLFILFTVCLITTHAQDFAGYRTGNYTGVNGAFFNPANIADSRYRFDFNLFSISAGVGNNQASFKLSNIGSFNDDEINDKIFGENATKSSGIVSAGFYGPSLMFNTGKKMAFALTTRVRAMANVVDINGRLINKIGDDFISNDPTLPYTISSNDDMRFNINAWGEYGLSAARVIKDEGNHFFKAGFTLKYLAGVGNAYMSIANFNGTLNQDLTLQDNYLANTTGRIAASFGGIRISDIDADQLTKMKGKGFGADVGFVYEFRPGFEKYKTEDGKGWKGNKNKYKLKVSLALLDIGQIKYTKDMQRSGAYNINITGSKRFYLSQLDNIDIDDYNAFFKSRPQYFTADKSNAETSYKVSLPSTMQIDIDYHLHKGFYVSLGSQVSLINGGNKPYGSSYYSGITLTPRYEGKGIGLYIPINYNGLTNFNAGASLRLGPLFVGSGSLLTALLGNSKQADVFMGLRFGGLK